MTPEAIAHECNTAISYTMLYDDFMGVARGSIQYKLFSSVIIICYQKIIIKFSRLTIGDSDIFILFSAMVNTGLGPTHVATFLSGLNIPAPPFHSAEQAERGNSADS